jgi:hypothetical protein
MVLIPKLDFEIEDDVYEPVEVHMPEASVQKLEAVQQRIRERAPALLVSMSWILLQAIDALHNLEVQEQERAADDEQAKADL